jgi:hypothetical protein
MVGLGGMHNGFFNIIRADVHDMGLRVIKPNNCVVMRHLFPFVK